MKKTKRGAANLERLPKPGLVREGGLGVINNTVVVLWRDTVRTCTSNMRGGKDLRLLVTRFANWWTVMKRREKQKMRLGTDGLCV